LAGCAGADQPSARPSADASAAVGCAAGTANPDPLAEGWRATSVVSGPLTLAYIDQYAIQPRDAFAPVREGLRRILADPASDREERVFRRALERTPPDSYEAQQVPVRVAAGEQATLSVTAGQRSSVALIPAGRDGEGEGEGVGDPHYRVADGEPAVTLRACSSAATQFPVRLVVAGARCVELSVSSPGRVPERLRLPFGRGTCAASAQRETRGKRFLGHAPYLGMACPKANSIACDRVGLTVWLKRAATGVSASVNGRPLRLEAGGTGGRPPATHWEGFLQPAGMLRGALKITPDRLLGGDRYYWVGSHFKDAWVTIAIRRPDGSTDEASLPVPLAAGYG
jgi:hypothetical protein